jgi:thiol reductant ABC exporter CydD subunit
MRAPDRARPGAVAPRLLHYARATRPFLVALVVLGGLTALLIVAQAWLLADVIAAAFRGGADVAGLTLLLAVLLGVVLGRAVVAWGRELVAHRSSARAKAQLRAALLAHLGALGPGHLRRRRAGELAVLTTRGVDTLDGYFSLYLPQLILAVIVPAAVLVAVGLQDWISALIIAGTLPLIPLFMVLVGAATRDRMAVQIQTLQQLGGHFLDVVGGLGTLKVFGRAKAQIQTIGQVTDRYRRAAISTLRVTFMSSLILELVATISVALVAVEIGLRLMRTALMVLVLAPEAYLPLRLLGTNYHASAEGMSAARQVFDVLETPLPTPGRRAQAPNPALTGLSVQDLRVEYPGRGEAAIAGISLTLEPQEILAVTGASGCGKSTLLAVLLGFVIPQSGSVRVGGCELSDLDLDAWRSRISWMPQRPHLFATSIADNIALGRPEACAGAVRDAVEAAGLRDVVARQPDGLNTVLGDRGAGLSVGERQRVALARAFVRDAPLLLLDEPTANLDGATEEEVLEALARLMRGRSVILVAHRPALVALADRVIELDRVTVTA